MTPMPEPQPRQTDESLAALRDRSERWQRPEFSLLAHMDTPLLWIDGDGTISWHNRSAAEAFPTLLTEERWDVFGQQLPSGFIYRIHQDAASEEPGILIECIHEADSHLREELQQVRQLNRELETVLNSVDELYITDGDGVTLRVNQDVARLYGVRSEDLIGKSVYDLERERIFYPSATAMALRSKKPMTVLQRTRDGRFLVVTAVPVFDENGDTVRVISSARDVTNLQWPTETNSQRIRTSTTSHDAATPTLSPPQATVDSNAPSWVAESPAMQQTMQMAHRVANTNTTVLLLGETGVGKNRFARLLHDLSSRKNAPFVEINCAAIPESLLESELFGYERGAFTGARREGKPGKVEMAHHGTLFLNEVGELPLNLQGKLLDLLQDHTVSRIGSVQSHRVSIRIIAATNRDVRSMVERGQFREDLYYRLSVFPISLPSLRERTEDLPALTSSWLTRYTSQLGIAVKSIHPETVELLARHPWPGNIRELENLLERLAIMVDDAVILPHHLPGQLSHPALMGNPPSSSTASSDSTSMSPENLHDISEADSTATAQGDGHLGLDLKSSLARLERSMYEEAALHETSTYRIAKYLNVSQPTVVRKLQQYGISLQRQ